MDEATKRPYYFNRTTGQRSWVRPAAAPTAAAAVPASASGAGGAAVSTGVTGAGAVEVTSIAASTQQPRGVAPRRGAPDRARSLSFTVVVGSGGGGSGKAGGAMAVSAEAATAAPSESDGAGGPPAAPGGPVAVA
jgi:hypothetical protein